MDAQRAAGRERDQYRRARITRDAMKGKSVAQITGPRKWPRAKDGEMDLFLEKERLEAKITSLKARLKTVVEKLGRLEKGA